VLHECTGLFTLSFLKRHSVSITFGFDMTCMCSSAGVSIPPEAMMHFPRFRFPPCFQTIFWLRGKFPKFYLFLKNFLIFIRQNFWLSFFSHQPQILNFPLIFAVSIHFSLFREFFLSTLLLQISPWVRKIYVFLHTLCVFRFPHFDHDTFMHHTKHVLDASDLTQS